MNRKFSLILLLLFIFTHLSAAEKKILITFKNENTVIITKENAKGEVLEKKTVKRPLSDIDLQLRDLLVYNLQERSKNIILIDLKSSYDYLILINPIYLSYGNSYGCTVLVEIKNKDNSLISKKLIQTYKDPLSLTNELSGDIAKYILEVLK